MPEKKGPSQFDLANAKFEAKGAAKLPVSTAVESTADERVVNNTMRHTYRVLSEEETDRMQRIKDAGAQFLTLLHEAGGTDPAAGRLASRELSLAQTKIEEAVMWAVKHVTA